MFVASSLSSLSFSFLPLRSAMSGPAQQSQEMYLTEVPLQDCTCYTPPYTACWLPVKPSSPVSPPSARGGHSWSDQHNALHQAVTRHTTCRMQLSHRSPPFVDSALCAPSTYIPQLSSVLIFGGSTREARFYNDLYLYDLSTNSWSHPTSPSTTRPPPRSGHTAVLHDNTLLVYGGQHIRLPATQHANPTVTFYSDVWQLDLASFDWHKRDPTTAPTPAPRRNGHTAWLRDGSMWVVGGSDENGPAGTVWRLDVGEWQWYEVKVSEGECGAWDGRELHGMAVEGGGERVWLCGGRSENGVLTTRHALELTSSGAVWSQMASSPARCAHSLVTLQTSGPIAAPKPAAANDEEAKQQLTAVVDALSLQHSTPPSLLLFGGTDGLTFYNDLTLLTAATLPAAAAATTACPTCNGPLGCHRLGGGAKADNQNRGNDTEEVDGGGKSGKRGKKRGKDGLNGWPAHRFAHSLTAVRLRDGRAGYVLFGGMDEERDMNDAHVLTVELLRDQPTVAAAP